MPSNLGALSADQARFRSRFVALTGLDPLVVTAWIGEESGWARVKASHNYLNTGPGEVFASAEQAAQRAGALVNDRPDYAGVRAARATGGLELVRAIGSSPWGTIGTRLERIYEQLRAAPPGATRGAAAAPVAQLADVTIEGPFGPDITVPFFGPDISLDPLTPGFGFLGDLPFVGDVLDAATGPFERLAAAVLDRGFTLALGLLFTLAALALIGLGVANLTGRGPRQVIEEVATVAALGGAAKGAAAL